VVVDIEEVAIGDKKESKISKLMKRLKSKNLWSMITGEENSDEEKLKQEEKERLKKEEEQRLLAQKKSEEKIKAEEVAKSENKKSLWSMIKSLMKGKKD
jgi:NCAIR mutase (PurE)-related protein